MPCVGGTGQKTEYLGCAWSCHGNSTEWKDRDSRTCWLCFGVKPFCGPPFWRAAGSMAMECVFWFHYVQGVSWQIKSRKCSSVKETIGFLPVLSSGRPLASNLLHPWSPTPPFSTWMLFARCLYIQWSGKVTLKELVLKIDEPGRGHLKSSTCFYKTRFLSHSHGLTVGSHFHNQVKLGRWGRPWISSLPKSLWKRNLLTPF